MEGRWFWGSYEEFGIDVKLAAQAMIRHCWRSIAPLCDRVPPASACAFSETIYRRDSRPPTSTWARGCR